MPGGVGVGLGPEKGDDPVATHGLVGRGREQDGEREPAPLRGAAGKWSAVAFNGDAAKAANRDFGGGRRVCCGSHARRVENQWRVPLHIYAWLVTRQAERGVDLPVDGLHANHAHRADVRHSDPVGLY